MKIWAQFDVWLLRKVFVVGGWWVVQQQNRVTPSPFDFGLWTLAFRLGLGLWQFRKLLKILHLEYYRSLYVSHSRRYHGCMNISYSGTSFHDLDHDHPFVVFEKIVFFVPTCIIPFLYLRVFFYRRVRKELNLDKKSIKRRKIGNVVSLSYNILIWISDLLGLILVL